MDRISRDYIAGYTKAILDIQEIFEYICLDVKVNNNTARQLLKCILDNRAKIRENRKGFIRYNRTLKAFEFYEKDTR